MAGCWCGKFFRSDMSIERGRGREGRGESDVDAPEVDVNTSNGILYTHIYIYGIVGGQVLCRVHVLLVT